MSYDATRPPHPTRSWEQRLRDAGESAEADVRRLVGYINDEVVPDIRRNGSEALRAAASELQRLAARMDDARHPPTPGTASPEAPQESPDAPKP